MKVKVLEFAFLTAWFQAPKFNQVEEKVFPCLNPLNLLSCGDTDAAAFDIDWFYMAEF